jgi:hypothetical protein
MIMTETRERTGRLKEDKEDTRVFDRQKNETPSILPWQDRGRVKIGFGSNGQWQLLTKNSSEKARVPEFDQCTFLSRATHSFPER